MKKIFTLLICAIFTLGFAQAQLSFSAKKVDVKLMPGQGWKFGHIYVSNIGSSPIKLGRKVLEDNMKGNWDVQFCECSNCYTNAGGKTIAQQINNSPACSDIQPGKTFKQDWKVGIRIKSGDAASIAYFKVEVTDKTNNKKDTLVYTTVDASAVVERANEYSISFYPNPAQNELFINAEFESGNNVANVTLVDMLGHVVRRKVISGSSNVFVDVSDLPSGLFFLVVEKEGEVIMSERVFKN